VLTLLPLVLSLHISPILTKQDLRLLQKEYAWAVAVGALGIFFTLMYCIMMKMGMSEGAPGP